MAKFGNRAEMAVSTTGTGSPLTLGAATEGAQTWGAAGIGDGDPVEFVLEDGVAWETCTGVYSASGPSVTRVTAESSNSGSPLNLTGNAIALLAPHADFFNQAVDWGLITGALSATDDYGSIA